MQHNLQGDFCSDGCRRAFLPGLEKKNRAVQVKASAFQAKKDELQDQITGTAESTREKNKKLRREHDETLIEERRKLKAHFEQDREGDQERIRALKDEKKRAEVRGHATAAVPPQPESSNAALAHILPPV